MSVSIKHKKVSTVGSLKKFLESIPDKTPIRFAPNGIERARAYYWRETPEDDCGPNKPHKRWVSIEED